MGGALVEEEAEAGFGGFALPEGEGEGGGIGVAVAQTDGGPDAFGVAGVGEEEGEVNEGGRQSKQQNQI